MIFLNFDLRTKVCSFRSICSETSNYHVAPVAKSIEFAADDRVVAGSNPMGAISYFLNFDLRTKVGSFASLCSQTALPHTASVAKAVEFAAKDREVAGSNPVRAIYYFFKF